MITEDQLEQPCLGWFRKGGWETVFGPDLAHDGSPCGVYARFCL